MVDLDRIFRERIAELDGVKPEEVTVEYIRQQREKRIYPDARFNIYSSYVCGGIGLAHFTRNELNRVERGVDEIMKMI